MSFKKTRKSTRRLAQIVMPGTEAANWLHDFLEVLKMYEKQIAINKTPPGMVDVLGSCVEKLHDSVDHVLRDNVVQISGFLVEELLRISANDRNEAASLGCSTRKLLSAFAWFCSRENREHIELVGADLKKDARQMRKEGRSAFFIRAVLLWHAIFGTMLPIFWDGLCRVVAKGLPITKVIAGIKGSWFK